MDKTKNIGPRERNRVRTAASDHFAEEIVKTQSRSNSEIRRPCPERGCGGVGCGGGSRGGSRASDQGGGDKDDQMIS